MKVKILQNATDKEYATFICPKCSTFGIIDREQYEGKISIQCPNCDFHETVDFRQVLDSLKKLESEYLEAMKDE